MAVFKVTISRICTEVENPCIADHHFLQPDTLLLYNLMKNNTLFLLFFTENNIVQAEEEEEEDDLYEPPPCDLKSWFPPPVMTKQNSTSLYSDRSVEAPSPQTRPAREIGNQGAQTHGMRNVAQRPAKSLTSDMYVTFGSSQDPGVVGKPWYVGGLERNEAEKALRRMNKNGCFLVRLSSVHNHLQPYTLVVLYNEHIYNIPIRALGARGYSLGKEGKQHEETFSSVVHLIEHYQNDYLHLINRQTHCRESTILLYPALQ
ncbi:Hypothetical predicted protein [Pelobates cultripes]|uniref:SH2 domain-containing protein n=1 Tax=Pelobates cultripes TaxID=61616 RepID=A0AAD1RNB4_PELCU|nr:Hypothetical predicted protein [Pelobates cultripes]